MVPMGLGERIAWYRRRRGMAQQVLADRIGRTVDWLSKVENGRIQVDRLSVLRSIGTALDISLGSLLEDDSIQDRPADVDQTVPAVRATLMDYRQLTRLFNDGSDSAPASPSELRNDVANIWNAYQGSRFGYVLNKLPHVLGETGIAVNSTIGADQHDALRMSALTYQAAATALTKVGEPDLAWIAADRALTAAEQTADPLIIGSVFRGVTHALLSTRRFDDGMGFTDNAVSHLDKTIDRGNPKHLSVYGALLLAGVMAAARGGETQRAREYLRQAGRAADSLGGDANHLWTAFGPTNVAIHQVSAAMEIGDIQVAVDLGPRIDTSGLPVERRVRHALEVARAHNAWAQSDDALASVLSAYNAAPEHVQHHFITRTLLHDLLRRSRGQPDPRLANLARCLQLNP